MNLEYAKIGSEIKSYKLRNDLLINFMPEPFKVYYLAKIFLYGYYDYCSPNLCLALDTFCDIMQCDRLLASKVFKSAKTSLITFHLENSEYKINVFQSVRLSDDCLFVSVDPGSFEYLLL